ncbi:MAG: hypothetical protein COB76_05430 [Alphaproteobacteria bacterium]|nr:MAG: hypothetical protein COB76_05430 [Alphaproteobacteria bacterium]
MDWNRLDKTQSQQILQHISIAADPGMFAPNSSEASFKPLSFYQDYMIYRVTNYATLPSFSLDFLSDGESFHLLDGSPSPISIVNTKGTLYLTETNVIDYVEFYLENIRGDDGDIYMIGDVENLPFLDSLSLDQQVNLKQQHVAPSIAINEETEDFIVLCDLFYDGTLVQAGISVTTSGEINIQPREMIMASHAGGRA